MKTETSPPNNPSAANGNARQMLASLPVAAMLVDPAGHRVVLLNQAAALLLHTAAPAAHTTCHALLGLTDLPCQECPATDPNGLPLPRSATIRTADGTDCFLKFHCSVWQGANIVILHDISREINLLRSTDLARKELQAKLIIHERRHREALTTLHHLEQTIDHVPEALLTVDESFFILKKNRATEAFPAGALAHRCFELMGRTAPCDDCPATDGFAGVTTAKKRHTVDGLHFTETITRSPFDNGGLLLFRETTRQIQLLEQIREQQDRITRSNDILSGLARFGTYMQQETELPAVADFFLELLLPVVQTDAGAVVINDTRPGNILCHLQKGITDREMNNLMRAYLSRDMQTCRQGSLPQKDLPWHQTKQIHLLGTDGRRVGFLALKGVGDEHDDNIKLFTEPLGACINNRLLMLKLEERANTDPLTGLYNRGYFHCALEEERRKFQDLRIDFAVVVADINRLKQANDLYGHDAGDLLITTVSDLLSQAMRSEDIVARVGGDEFFILLAGTGSDGAHAFINRLRQQVLRDAVVMFGPDQEFPIEVSLGFAATDQVKGEELIKEADRAMYADKESYYQRHPERRRAP
ncbi:MAG: GGDEF domain-containing protein [Desulfobulbaceae bacterium]|nr:GGDEF domain-containing protein [Desulfobulbaceae bacterium]